MKIKSQLTLATLIVAAMFATGCQQMQQTAGASQQTTGGSQQTAEAATTETPDQAATGGDANSHTHADAPACASKTHSHPGATPGHTHVYGCVAGQRPVVPKVKAKGNYKGAVMMDEASKATMQQYQK
ncbi:MAG: hypothetical protein KJ914_05140 [Gammaproteobacteria bacterium]|nr:hypothetical protein [Gammaproteobacteria bacterium]MBU1724963.1 hypothetical protein [Gammaproteobacteria bacterium]MBU2006846.1 hypothetical protein [Gammaproteobacteria bacterium]